MPDRYN